MAIAQAFLARECLGTEPGLQVCFETFFVFKSLSIDPKGVRCAPLALPMLRVEFDQMDGGALVFDGVRLYLKTLRAIRCAADPATLGNFFAIRPRE